MLGKAVAQLIAAIVLYIVLTYIGMLKILDLNGVRDYFKAPFMPWAIPLANTIPIYVFGYRLYYNTNLAIYIKRCACLCVLKGIVQLVTLVPAPGGIEPCRNRTFAGVIILGSCADMMFSGHTCLVYLLAPRAERFLFVIPVAIFLVLAEMHYTSDVIMAVLIGSWIEYKLPIPKLPKLPNSLKK